MSNVYEVKYEVRYHTKGTKKKWWDEAGSPIHVLANGDAQKAVRKAERYALASTFTWENDKGRNVTEIPVGFRLVSVERKLSVDVR